MHRIGIIGSENTHTLAFSDLFNKSGRYEDMRVVAIYGEDAAASRSVAEKCGIDLVAARAEDMLGRIDAIMVTSRNGALHPGYAMPFIEAGLPAFIDKPIANDGGEAWALLRRAREKGVPVVGGSSLKFTQGTQALRTAADGARAAGALMGGHIWAPVKMQNPYGDFYFYSSHLIETAMVVFGFDPVAVRAIRQEKGVFCLLRYADFTVHLSYMEEVSHYGGTVLGPDGATSLTIDLDGCYDAEADHFAHMLRTGETPQSIEDLAMPIFALNAIERAYTDGMEQTITLPW